MDNTSRIKAAIEGFIKGGDNADLERLDNILHEKFQNIQDGFFDKEGIYIINKTDYLGLIERGTFGGKPRTIQYELINDLGNIALCKVSLESESLKFTSYITVVQEGWGWQVIVNVPKIEKK